MKITTLLENDAIQVNLKKAHGLSLLIETDDKKILFDLGPNNYYLKNAKTLGIDLKEVDALIISHGHFDHGSGLQKFLDINKKADVYLSANAFNKQVKKVGMIKIPIGIKKPTDLERIKFIDFDHNINSNIKIVSSVEFKNQIINDNSLMTLNNGEYVIDQFDHEIYLVIQEGQNKVLFSGCSHKGIDNIIETIETKEGLPLTHVIAGFHFSHYNPSDTLQQQYLSTLGHKFAQKDTSYYSCHCTGDNAYDELKKQLEAKLNRIKTGSVINL